MTNAQKLHLALNRHAQAPSDLDVIAQVCDVLDALNMEDQTGIWARKYVPL